VRKIYSSFFSPQARLQAAYRAMHNRWYDLSEQVVRLEMKRYAPSQLQYELERGQRILTRCRVEFERFKKLPPQGNYKDTFYAENIPLLEQRLLAAAGQS
jgi:hypothetical protein